MLTPQQISQVKSANGVQDAPRSGFASTVTQGNSTPLDETSFSSWATPKTETKPVDTGKKPTLNPIKGTIEDATAGVKKFGEGFKQITEGGDFNHPDPVKLGRGVLNEFAGGFQTVFAPVTAAFRTITGGKVDEGFAAMEKSLEDNPESLPNKISDWKPFQDWAMKNPNAAEVYENLLTIATSVAGAKGGPEVAGKIKTAGVTALDKAPAIIEKTIDTTKDVGTAIKNKVMNTPTVEEAVGKVAQGSKDDVPSFARGLKNIDTKNIKSYEDLANASKKTISKLAEKQNENLASEKSLKRVDDFKVNVDGVEANYVKDALDQLKAHYEKTNDAKGLAKVKGYLDKANSEEAIDFTTNEKVGGGLTVQDVNNIAKLHGSDLNGFNANGELASGLSKQAAENTRKGLKTTVRENLTSDKAREDFDMYDKQMSDTFTVKDLTEKYSEAVNKLNQKLENPNILQKLSTAIGKAAKFTGVKAFLKEVGIGKEYGATSLNPVEIEAKLPKLLKIIDEGMKKGDDEFVREVLKLGGDKK